MQQTVYPTSIFLCIDVASFKMKLEVHVFINQLSVKRLTIFNTSKKKWQLMKTNIRVKSQFREFAGHSYYIAHFRNTFHFLEEWINFLEENLCN